MKILFPKQTGFTVAEALIVLGIIGLVAGITTFAFSKTGPSKALERNALLITSTLHQARSITISSKDNSQYGVHFGSTEIIIFKGDTYDPLDSENITVKLNSLVRISNISLSEGGVDVVFLRLSGKTNVTGSVILSLASDSSVGKTINIYGTGLSEIN